MSRPNNIPLITDDRALGGSTIERSLRFNGADTTAHLTRTPSTSGNRKVWTFSAWIKKTHTDDGPNYIYAANNGNTSYVALYFRYNKLYTYFHPTNNYGEVSDRLFRDVGSWFHVVHQVDAGDFGQKIWINGEALSLNSGRNPANNDYGWNQSGVTHRVGNASWRNDNIDGSLADVYHIDGQLKFPPDFAYTDFQTKMWRPKKYKGTYGTNGFHLEFKDNTNNAALGLDTSGQGNNFTVNNISSSHDNLLDTPTNNFCTQNPLDEDNPSTSTFSEGNLQMSRGTDHGNSRGTMGMSSGKWYFEYCCPTDTSGSASPWFGVCNSTADMTVQRTDGMWNYGGSSGQFLVRGSGNASTTDIGGGVISAGTVIGVAVDMDNKKIWLAKSNTWYGSTGSATDGNPNTGANPTDTFTDSEIPDGNLYPQMGIYNYTPKANFGQDSSFSGSVTAQGNTDENGIGDFYYAPPSGFLALCSNNLPPTVPSINAQKHFDVLTWTGNGSSGNVITGLEFQPDFIWAKSRGAGHDHQLIDVIGGTTKYLSSNRNDEATASDRITSINSNGFTLGSDARLNANSTTHVAWCWKAGGAAVSNSDGSITSSVSANQEAGFSVVSWTGSGADASVGHGLGKKPKVLFVKSRDNTDNWKVWFKGVTTDDSYSFQLDTSGANYSGSDKWYNSPNGNDTTTTTFGVSGDNATNRSGAGFAAYCWAEIPGFSKYGVYKGNGNANGSFVYTGFSPVFIIYKKVAAENWHMFDIKRQPKNTNATVIDPNRDAAETTDTNTQIDILSNGFKLRSSHGTSNASGSDYLYMAWAEHTGATPYQTDSNAR